MLRTTAPSESRSTRLAAVAALVLGGSAAVLVVLTAWRGLPRGLIVATMLVLAVGVLWASIRRRGAARTIGLAIAVLLLVAGVVVLVSGRVILEGLLAIVLILGALAAARVALSVRATYPRAPRPQHAVMIWNPRSGGGKAVAHHLADEARARGITPIELTPGDDLVTLVRDAVASGADALAAAGGDGTQALVASIAAEHDLPFACIPAGTRNHFALDLGVDRDDVVGALDAFVDGGERRVDLAEVNGRVFVNNVSLGLYAEAVQRAGYRDAKLRTILDTVPDVVGGDAPPTRELRWTDPDGVEQHSAAVMLVSNNVYRLGHAIGAGTRPRLDAGRLGVAVLAAPSRDGSDATGVRPPAREWSTPSFEIASGDRVPVGVDGEALVLDPPLRLVSRPRALRVRLAPQHPGASPSAERPDTIRGTVGRLARLAVGGDATTPPG